jgi:uncharacterized protein YaiE (UPF0345 family)
MITSHAQWTEILNLSPNQNIQSISFINSSTGFALATNSDYSVASIYKTSNHGDSWICISSITGTSYDFNLSNISFFNDNSGIISASWSGGTNYRSDNGGVTWSVLTLPGTIFKIDRGVIFLQNSNFPFLVNQISTDSGFNFLTIPGFSTNNMLDMVNTKNGFVLELGGQYPFPIESLFYTNNTGESLISINTISGRIIDFSFSDINNGYFLKYDYSNSTSSILTTKDGGVTVSITSTFSNIYFNNIESLSPNHFILNYTKYSPFEIKVFESTDGGITLNDANLPSGSYLTSTGDNFFGDNLGYSVIQNSSSGTSSLYRYNATTTAPINNTSSGSNIANYQFSTQNTLSSCINSDLLVALNVISATSGIIGLDFEIPYDETKFYVKSVTAGNLLISTNNISINTISGSPNKLLIGISTSSLTGNGSMLIGNSGNVLQITYGTIGLLPDGTYSFNTAEVIESYLTTNTGFTISGANNIIVSSTGTNLLLGDVYLGNSATSLSNNGGAKITLTESVNCNTFGNPVVLSSANSSFSITPSVGTNSLKITRSIVTSAGVSSTINSTDAIAITLIRQGIAPYQNPTLHQLLAADINNDGAVTSGDKTQVLRRSVLNLSSFTTIPNATDWKFYKKGNTYTISKNNVPNVSSCVYFTSTGTNCLTFETLSIVGVLTGDVNENYSSSASGANLREESTGNLIFDLSTKVSNGTQLVGVYFDNDADDLGLDFTFDYIQSGSVSIKNVIYNNAILEEAEHNIYNGDKLLFSGIMNVKPTEKTPILWIEFETSAQLTENDFDLTSSYALSNDKRIATSLRMQVTTNITENLDKGSIKVFPNPTENGKVTVTTNTNNWSYAITDLIGNEIQTGISLSTTHQISNLTKGVYFIKINNSITHKIVVY